MDHFTCMKLIRYLSGCLIMVVLLMLVFEYSLLMTRYNSNAHTIHIREQIWNSYTRNETLNRSDSTKTTNPPPKASKTIREAIDKSINTTCNCIILSCVNSGYLDFFENMLISMQRHASYMRNMVLVIAEDGHAYDYLTVYHPSRLLPIQPRENNSSAQRPLFYDTKGRP